MSYPHGERGLPSDQHPWFSFPSCPQSLFGSSQCDVSIWLPGYFSHHDWCCHVCTNSSSCKGREAGAVVCAQPWSQKGTLRLSNLASNVMSQLGLRNIWRRSDQKCILTFLISYSFYITLQMLTGPYHCFWDSCGNGSCLMALETPIQIEPVPFCCVTSCAVTTRIKS